MSGIDPGGRIRQVHVGGVAVVRVRGGLDAEIAPEFSEAVAGELTAGATVVLDLDGGEVAPAGVDAVTALLAAAGDAGADVLVVSTHESARETLRAAGIEVHASIDDGLGDTSAPLTSAATPSANPRLIPSGGDALLVGNDDIAAPQRDR
jgi:anti-anti-sigma factor